MLSIFPHACFQSFATAVTLIPGCRPQVHLSTETRLISSKSSAKLNRKNAFNFSGPDFCAEARKRDVLHEIMGLMVHSYSFTDVFKWVQLPESSLPSQLSTASTLQMTWQSRRWPKT